jgi:hypothetical protein
MKVAQLEAVRVVGKKGGVGEQYVGDGVVLVDPWRTAFDCEGNGLVGL